MQNLKYFLFLTKHYFASCDEYFAEMTKNVLADGKLNATQFGQYMLQYTSTIIIKKKHLQLHCADLLEVFQNTQKLHSMCCNQEWYPGLINPIDVSHNFLK